MIRQTITITNPTGLHMRPAAVFAQEMAKFKCDVHLRYKGSRVNAKSLLSIIAAVIKCGAVVNIECEGEDELAAMTKAIELIEGFTE